MTTNRKDEIVRINLTPSQSDEVKARTGIDASAIELTVEELEERIAPQDPGRLAANSNETMLGG